MTTPRPYDAESRGVVRRFLASLPDAETLRSAIDDDNALTDLMGDVFHKRGAGRERALRKLRRNRHGLLFSVCADVTGAIALARAPWAIAAINGRSGVEAFEQPCLVTITSITSSAGMLRGSGALVLSAHTLLRAVQRGRYAEATLRGAVLSAHSTLSAMGADGFLSLPLRRSALSGRNARLLPDARGAWIVEALTAATKLNSGDGLEAAKAMKLPVRTFYGIPEPDPDEDARLAPWRSNALAPKALGWGMVHGAAMRLGATKVPGVVS